MPVRQTLTDSCRRSPLVFFLLVFALSTPFLVTVAFTRFQLLPGVPVSALMAACPLMAALILVYIENRIEGVTALLKRSFDHERIRTKIWYAPIILLMPAINLMAYGIMLMMDRPVPSPQIPLIEAPALIAVFFVAGLGEELGWSGYAIDRLQERWTAVQASILLGVVLAVWHVGPLLQADRSMTWIAWWTVGAVAQRVLYTWLYNNTGKSVFGATLFHAMSNLSWQLFPNRGSHYDPRITGLIIAVAAAVVTVGWGPRTLARSANA